MYIYVYYIRMEKIEIRVKNKTQKKKHRKVSYKVIGVNNDRSSIRTPISEETRSIWSSI